MLLIEKAEENNTLSKWAFLNLLPRNGMHSGDWDQFR